MKGYTMNKNGRAFEINLDSDNCYVVSTDTGAEVTFCKKDRFDKVREWIDWYSKKQNAEAAAERTGLILMNIG